MQQFGKKIIDIGPLVDLFEAQEGEVQHIIGKIGNGKTYEGTRRAWGFLIRGKIVYTTWHLILPAYYDERDNFWLILWKLITFNNNFYRFDFKKNWQYLDIDRPDLIEFVANLTDCIVMLDEGQDIFDSSEGRAISEVKRKTITRARHLKKTLIIISQRAQAVAVTARANVTWFYKCVKVHIPFLPFNYFRVYRTEEMDEQNYPIWEHMVVGAKPWKAELWHSGFERKRIYNMYNSWYLREGIAKSQDVYFDAYKLSANEKIKSLFRKKEEVPLAYTYEEMVQKAREKQLEHKAQNAEVSRKQEKKASKKIKEGVE